MVNVLLGQQSGYTTFPCFLCLWNSRDRTQHYTKKEWPLGEALTPLTSPNVIREPLVDSDRSVLPPLHIKLGLSMQFMKARNKEGNCFRYLCNVFPALSTEKVKAGIFDGLQIRQRIKEKHFENSMEANEQNAWNCFVLVVKNFLGSTKAENYKELVSNMIDAFKDLECNMSIKLHYLYSHNEKFPENLGSMRDEQGEWFHHDIKEMEIRYQGRWDAAMMADFCRPCKRDIVDAAHSRNAKKRHFCPYFRLWLSFFLRKNFVHKCFLAKSIDWLMKSTLNKLNSTCVVKIK